MTGRCTLLLYHQHGLGGLHAALIAGGTVHIRSKFTAADLVDTIGGTGASVLFAVPTIYKALANAEVPPGRLRTLRLAVCGSAPLEPGVPGAAAPPARAPAAGQVRHTESGLNVSNPARYPARRHDRGAAARRADPDQGNGSPGRSGRGRVRRPA
jgi:malonyl-CoA/methylmalonyl-CoA synthetase